MNTQRNEYQPLFALGQVLATPGALAMLDKAGQTPFELLARHHGGDWGNLPDEDVAENELALRIGTRILSSYILANGEQLWIITEADRSATTLLLPQEY